MTQRRGGLDLDHEPLAADHGGQLGLQHLERDLAIVLQILGQVHGGHAALPELALDAVAVGQGRGETIGRRSHRFRMALRSVSQWSTQTRFVPALPDPDEAARVK